MFNFLSKLGTKNWRGAKSFLTDFYSPIHKTIHGIHKGASWVDKALANAHKVGIPNSMIDIVKDNPLYASIMSGINYAVDVDNDIRDAAGFIDRTVERGLLPKIGRIGAGQGYGPAYSNLNYGMTPNRSASATQFVNQNSAAS